jgi:hypothetical protein
VCTQSIDKIPHSAVGGSEERWHWYWKDMAGKILFPNLSLTADRARWHLAQWKLIPVNSHRSHESKVITKCQSNIEYQNNTSGVQRVRYERESRTILYISLHLFPPTCILDSDGERRVTQSAVQQTLEVIETVLIYLSISTTCSNHLLWNIHRNIFSTTENCECEYLHSRW